jgi:nucleotide-binding universal stress UspA family protein
MFSKILYPTDFSAHSNEVVNCIINLKSTGTKDIIILHVIDKRLFAQFPEVSTEVIDAMKASAEESVAEAAAKLNDAGFSVETKIEIGVPFHQIVALARAEAVSLIVMGSHGRSLVEEMLLGSTTENVLRHTTVPILIEKYETKKEGEKVTLKRHTKNPFKKILFPTDFSECSLSVVPYIKKLKEAGTKEVVVAHIQDMTKLSPHLLDKLPEFESIDEERMADIKADLSDAGIPKVKTILKEGVPFNEIAEIGNKENVSLIAIGSHGKSMVKEMLLGSISGKIVRKINRPILVIRRKQSS